MRSVGALVLLLVGCKPDPETTPHPPSVILIVLDGVRTDEFTGTFPSDATGVTGEAYAAETWATLAPAGTVVRAAHNTGITITAPAHAALVTGRVEPLANFPIDSALGPGLYRPTVPTIFEEARMQLDLSDAEVLLLANTELLSPIGSSVYPGLGEGAEVEEVWNPAIGLTATEDGPVVDRLLERIAEAPPRLALVNLHDVDRAGHYGEGDDYIEGVTLVDGILARLWNALESQHPDYAETLLLVVTADHGRHRHDDDQGWHNHGDACDGCREVPLFVVGGGAALGEVADARVAAIDLPSAMAAHLGIDLPWGEGLPSAAVFPEFDGAVRSGDVAIAADGSVQAFQRWIDDGDQRSEVWVGGALASTPGVFAAEAPSVLDTPEGVRVCMRELAFESTDGYYPWVARCLAELDGEWKDIGFPDPEVSPIWRAALAAREGVTWAAFPYNPRAAGTAGIEGRIGLGLTAWTATGWTVPVVNSTIFPTDAAITATATGLTIASGGSGPDPESRYTRKIKVFPVALGGEAPVWGDATFFTLEALLGGGARVEYPALAASGDAVRIAMLGLTESGGTIATATSVDGGALWSSAQALPSGGAPFPAIGPAWDGEDVVWAALDGDEAVLCRASPEDLAAACVAVGSSRIASFVAADGVATVVRDGGVGQWETAVVTW